MGDGRGWRGGGVHSRLQDLGGNPPRRRCSFAKSRVAERAAQSAIPQPDRTKTRHEATGHARWKASSSYPWRPVRPPLTSAAPPHPNRRRWPPSSSGSLPGREPLLGDNPLDVPAHRSRGSRSAPRSTRCASPSILQATWPRGRGPRWGDGGDRGHPRRAGPVGGSATAARRQRVATAADIAVARGTSWTT